MYENNIMSLTKFLKLNEVKIKFREFFPKPRFSIQRELLAPPLTRHYSKVGTAFDYLLRFYVKYLYPEAICNKWIAENSRVLLKLIILEKQLDKDSRLPISSKETAILDKFFINLINSIESNNAIYEYKDQITFIEHCYHKVDRIISDAKENYSMFLLNGNITNTLLESTLLLAQVDNIYRARRISENLGIFDQMDIKDLRNLISLVNQKELKPNNVCILNPNFGQASLMVGGADADLIIDDMLIDIKTTKNLKMDREYYNQLIGYYTLYRIGGVNNTTMNIDIKKLGVYFSRHGYLHLYNIEDIIDETEFSKFIKWFKEKAIQEYGKI
ncbi:hypothetical protein LCGC14_1792120 [marine sediment metagenome]|uniref:Uncharacterized protein n=1 Tax=marine sediment metagenome TaxID=412755 RepID=A0A0F9JRQ4_9ZZZZ